MDTYWDTFIRQYEKEIADKSLRIILEAYWYWCNRKPFVVCDKCNELMGRK